MLKHKESFKTVDLSRPKSEPFFFRLFKATSAVANKDVFAVSHPVNPVRELLRVVTTR